MELEINLKEMEEFLIEAKKLCYSNCLEECENPERKTKDLIFNKNNWSFINHHVGFCLTPLQEVLSYKEIPIWEIGYHKSAMLKRHLGYEFKNKVMGFLREALIDGCQKIPFRGSTEKEFIRNDLVYKNEFDGKILRFAGTEKIFHNKKEALNIFYLSNPTYRPEHKITFY